MLGLFVPEVSVVEKIVRSVVIYLFLLAAFRFGGKRQIGQLTPFDLVVLLVISNVLQNVRLIADAVREAGLASPLLDACHALYRETQALGLAGADMVAVIRAIEGRTAAVSSRG